VKRESKERGYCAKCIVFILSKRIKVCNKIDGIAPCIGIEDYGLQKNKNKLLDYNFIYTTLHIERKHTRDCVSVFQNILHYLQL
jgi:hypothetical protein